MRILPVSGDALVCFLVALLFAVNFCHGKDYNKTVEVIGSGECADCALANVKPSKAFSGLRVTISCKPQNGNGGFKTRGTGEVDVEGKFKVRLPEDIVDEDGKLKEECYVQLHSASGTPCPAYDGLESSKLVLKIKTNEKHTFGLAKNMKLKLSTCASDFQKSRPPVAVHPSAIPIRPFPRPDFTIPIRPVPVRPTPLPRPIPRCRPRC